MPAEPHGLVRCGQAGLQAASGLDDRGARLQIANPCGLQAGGLQKYREFEWNCCVVRAYNRRGKSARQPLCALRMEESPGPLELDAG